MEITEVKTYSLTDKPESALKMRKKTCIYISFMSEPFYVDTQEGRVLISPDTVDDWDSGYWLVYPDDGSKPYAISPKFMYDNYEAAL